MGCFSIKKISVSVVKNFKTKSNKKIIQLNPLQSEKNQVRAS